MQKSKIFLALCFIFALGITFAPANTVVRWLMSFLAVVLLSITRSKIVLLAILIFLFGIYRFDLADSQDELANFYNQTLEVRGVVIEEADKRTDKILITFGELIINNHPVQGKILVQLPRYPEIDYGTELIIKGKILEPKNFDDFSYKQYLARFGIQAVIYNPKIISQTKNRGQWYKHFAINCKKQFTRALSTVLPEPENGFLQGMLLGQRRSIPESIIEQFNKTGTSHIVALSGFNITIIVSGMSKLFSRFGRRFSLIISTVLILLFVVMTGAQASVVRAAIMGMVAQLATNIGRIYYATNALAMSAVIMLVHNPLLLRFDIGFQLSFLAVVGLIYITPVLEDLFPHLPKFFKDYLLPTIAAQLASAPLIFLYFERISVIAPLVNLIILPIVPIAMAAGFATGVLSLITPGAGQLIGWITWLILHLILKVIEVFSSIPFSSVTIVNVPGIVPILFYLLLIIFLIYKKWAMPLKD